MTTSTLRLPLLFAAGLALLPAALLAAEQAPQCTYVNVATLPIRFAGAGLVPAVDGTIDGTPATMLIDTGSDDTYLTRNATEKRGLALHMTGRYVSGIAGSSRLYWARLKDFGIGPAQSSRKIELPVIGHTTNTLSFDAIAGAPFLFQMDMEISLRDKELKLHRPQNCDDTYLPYWNEQSIVIPFERGHGKSPNPHFTVMLNGHKLEAMIGTGAHHTTLTLAAAKRLGINVDAPGVKRLNDLSGVGAEHVAHWSAPIDTFSIGGEMIRGGEIGIVDSQSNNSADVVLGQDFLRAHRLLFAVGQRKLYLAYLGGDVFARRDGLEPWMRQEAEAGNADAQYRLALMYGAGSGVEKNSAVANNWLELAAASGSPQANLVLGRDLVRRGRYPDAIARINAGLDQLPAERYGELWLYLARLRNGETELAKSELQARTAKHLSDAWPAPIADFYLGKINGDKLLKLAASEDYQPKQRGCEARTYMAEWHTAHGDKDTARALIEARRVECAPPKGAPKPDAG
ncbi:retroviral-like aspartic protease family protein [Massilia horti]|uniref:Peptidase A2 domain-containing protein n=1 Tax=Massilia horti TaxID=2562153 RepID=A0A4Y9T375_9BURK|nr:retroviral-like aspartic protease family protein [Massilia horti]TFW34052.1 hypothetical protein E4O92_05200 [Massilia horti]